MYSDLSINYEALKEVSDKVNALAGEFQTLLNNISQANESLKSGWKGADAEAYTGKISEQAPIMQKLQDKLEEISVYLNNVNNAYSQKVEENRSSIIVQ